MQLQAKCFLLRRDGAKQSHILHISQCARFLGTFLSQSHTHKHLNKGIITIIVMKTSVIDYKVSTNLRFRKAWNPHQLFVC